MHVKKVELNMVDLQISFKVSISMKITHGCNGSYIIFTRYVDPKCKQQSF